MTLNFGQNLFPQRGELLVNFDWVDIASATGIQVYQAWAGMTDGGVSYNLVENSAATNLKGIATQTAAGAQSGGIDGAKETGGTYVKTLDVDFDLTEFQLPQIIRGTGYIDMSYSVGGSSGTDSYLVFRIRKWDGTPDAGETEIMTDTTQVVVNFDVEIKVSMPLVIPQTHFKKGERLRLTVEAWTKDSGAVTIGADPQDGTAAASGNDYFALTNTRLRLYIPYKIPI